ncbi:unnamed protein product [Pedinophyceae sp. YPF-701]|nr:unnamed protein product [Pedinophyceae sp. YPF-701]
MAVNAAYVHNLEDRLAALEARETALESASNRQLLQDASEVAASLDGGYMLMSGFLVFFMQAGFAMLCAGSVRSKNTMNILLKNVLDACAGSLGWWLFGFGLAYGKCSSPNGFIGCGNLAMYHVGEDHGFQTWFFQWAFAAAAATITSGSVAERTSLIAYFLYSIFLTAFVYPVVVHWVWDGAGWISAFKSTGSGPIADSGMIDFAGSGVVHMTGGFAGLIGAIAVGPRTGRFDADGKPVALPGHSATLVTLGTFILWFGWYGFNPGSTLAISSAGTLKVTAHVAVTTTLGAGSAGVTSLFLTYAQTGVWDLLAVCNGLLAGLVSITGPCPVVTAWAAVLIGAIGAFVFNYSCKLLEKLKIDDPLSAAPMHGFCGAWGVFIIGLLAKEDMVADAYGFSDIKGAFYGGNGKLLGLQILGIIVIAAWVCFWMSVLFFSLKFAGLLRVSPEEEMAGLDVSKHGGSAYNNDDMKKEKPSGL